MSSDTDSVEEAETNVKNEFSAESPMEDSLLSCLKSCRAEFVDDFTSVCSKSTRLPSLSWNWDEAEHRDSSYVSEGFRQHSDSVRSSFSSGGVRTVCRSTCLSFNPGESARPEYSSPQSPRYFLATHPVDVSGDELQTLLEGLDGNGPADEVASTRRNAANTNPGPQTTYNDSRETISPMDLAAGEYDYQGIPWPRFSISRSDYRNKRVREYSNYNNVNWTAKLEIERRMEISRLEKTNNNSFLFHECFKNVNPTIDHFQLRHLVWNTSPVTSFFVSNSTLYEYNKRNRSPRRIHAANPQQMACCHVNQTIAASGSFDSEVKITRLDNTDISISRKLSSQPNSITNHVNICGEARLVVANNDCYVSELAVDRSLDTIAKHGWNTAVNHVSSSPSGSILCLAGDKCDATLIDRRSMQFVCDIKGHLDYCFCSSWSDDNMFSTGSQDGTCRVWDMRKLDKPLACLGSLLGAVRSTRFSPNGRFLIFSEPADFVHIYDVETGLRDCQILDFFGNISGVDFSPDSSRLTVSLADTMFGCLIDFQVSTIPLNTNKRKT
jgi:WD40 repeat protein